jgi:predicted HD superfamily hydrolase involved in NAD metabolism
MLTIKEMEALLEKALPRKRFEHSIAVYETAIELAKIHNADMEKVRVASLVHDCGREIPTRDNLVKAAELNIPVDEVEANQPILLHAKLGVYLAQYKYGVEDKETLDAILIHVKPERRYVKSVMNYISRTC